VSLAMARNSRGREGRAQRGRRGLDPYRHWSEK
jgi:hypothetical protein